MKLDVLFMNLHRRYLNIDVKIGGFLGIYYLSAFLRANGYEAKGYSGTLRDGKNILDNFCDKGDISMLGLYCDFDNVTENIFLCRYIKEKYNIPIIVGGPQATALDDEFFLNSRCDAVVVGEGELTVNELVKYFINGTGRLESILGITYFVSSKMFRNQARPLIENLDSLSFITEDCYLEPVNFYQGLTIMTGRGCPFHCAFCHEGIGKGVRLRSVENILSEIDAYLTKWESDELYITFTDDTFTLNAKRLKKICDGIKSRSQNGCVLHFFCEGHIHTLYQHPEMIKYLAESGCQRLQLGIEAGTDEILKVYGKNSTVEEIFEVVRLCCEYGIKQVYGNIILGSAFFNEKIFEADKKFVKELLFVGKGVIEIGVVTFWALPNTQMTMHPEKFGMKICDTKFLTSVGDFPQAETADFDKLDIAEKQVEFEGFIESEMKHLLESGKISTSVIVGWFRQSQIRHPGEWFILLKKIEYLYSFYEMIYLGEGVESESLTDIENAHPLRTEYLYRCVKKISDDSVMIRGEKFSGKELKVATLTTGKLSVKEIAKTVNIDVADTIKILDRLETMHLIVYTLY